jgi:hypothetical protein
MRDGEPINWEKSKADGGFGHRITLRLARRGWRQPIQNMKVGPEWRHRSLGGARGPDGLIGKGHLERVYNLGSQLAHERHQRGEAREYTPAVSRSALIPRRTGRSLDVALSIGSPRRLVDNLVYLPVRAASAAADRLLILRRRAGSTNG